GEEGAAGGGLQHRAVVADAEADPRPPLEQPPHLPDQSALRHRRTPRHAPPAPTRAGRGDGMPPRGGSGLGGSTPPRGISAAPRPRRSAERALGSWPAASGVGAAPPIPSRAARPAGSPPPGRAAPAVGGTRPLRPVSSEAEEVGQQDLP